MAPGNSPAKNNASKKRKARTPARTPARAPAGRSPARKAGNNNKGRRNNGGVNVYRVNYRYPELGNNNNMPNLAEEGWNGPWLMDHLWLGPNFQLINNVSNSALMREIGIINSSNNENSRFKWLRPSHNIAQVVHWKANARAAPKRRRR